MAGLAAAQGNNGKCGVGVAFGAYVTGTLPSDSIHVLDCVCTTPAHFENGEKCYGSKI